MYKYKLANGVRDSILQTIEYVFFHKGNEYNVSLNVSSPRVVIVGQSELKFYQCTGTEDDRRTRRGV